MASMYPVKIIRERPVRSDDGSFPTQMPPAISFRADPTRAEREEMTLNPGAGGEDEVIFVSTREMMSSFRSRDVSSKRVRLCSLVCWPLAFQKRIEMSLGLWRGFFCSGEGTSGVVRLEGFCSMARHLCQSSSTVMWGYLRACLRSFDEVRSKLRLIGVVIGWWSKNALHSLRRCFDLLEARMRLWMRIRKLFRSKLTRV